MNTSAILISAVPSHSSFARHWATLLIFGALVLGGGFLCLRLDLWQDEYYTLHTTESGIVRAAHRAIDFELQPPLYFMLLAAWRDAHLSLFWARAFSLVAVVAAVYLWTNVARRMLPDVPGWAILAVTAASHEVLWAATEARCYGLVLLLASAIVSCWHHGYVAEPRSRVARIALVAVATAGLYTQYYLGFLLVAGAGGLVAARRWIALRDYLLAMAGVFVLLLPLLPTVGRQISGHQAIDPEASPGLVLAARNVYWRIQEYVLPLATSVEPTPTAWIVARDWLFRAGMVAAGVMAWRYRSRLPWPLIGYWAALSVMFVGLRLLVGDDMFVSRYTSALLWPTQLLVLAVVALPRKTSLVVTVALVMIVANTPAAWNRFAPLAKQGDWQRVADYLTESTNSGETVLVFTNVGVSPLEHYYRGLAPIVPLPGPLSLSRYDLAASELSNEAELHRKLHKELSRVTTFWVVTAHTDPFQGVDVHLERLESFLRASCRPGVERQFHGALVRQYSLIANTNTISDNQP